VIVVGVGPPEIMRDNGPSNYLPRACFPVSNAPGSDVWPYIEKAI